MHKGSMMTNRYAATNNTLHYAKTPSSDTERVRPLGIVEIREHVGICVWVETRKRARQGTLFEQNLVILADSPRDKGPGTKAVPFS